MIEVLKQMVAELEYVLDCINQEQMPFDGDDFHEALRLGRQAIAELENQKPLIKNMILACPSYLHDYTHPPQRTEPQIKTTDKFESAKVEDYNRGWNDCLFASGIVKQSQRIWQGLTDEEVKHEWEVWRANVPRYAGFAKGIEAKLKERNDHSI